LKRKAFIEYGVVKEGIYGEGAGGDTALDAPEHNNSSRGCHNRMFGACTGDAALETLGVAKMMPL
jgi:hypothetical protein